MAIQRIIIDDFRNHHTVDIVADRPFMVLAGANGSGKTNLLEALSLLVPGRGLRGAALADMPRIGGPGGFSILAHSGDVRLGTGMRADQPDRREVRINGAKSPANRLGEWMSMLWLTPAMDRLFMEGATARRRFLDRMVLALRPNHARHSSRYDRALRERNRILSGEERPDPVWLDGLEAAMAQEGAALALARQSVVAELAGWIGQAGDGPFGRADLCLIESGPTEADALSVEWRNARALDRKAGRTLSGPHRSDLAVMHAGKAMPAERCSTGEQKALLLSIVLAHAELVRQRHGQAPLLLLDEVAAHLDSQRRLALFDRLARMGGQVWLTGTDGAMFDGLEGQRTLLFTGQEILTGA